MTPLIGGFFMNKFVILVIALLLQGCGSFSPFPTHGGGKRYAIEQGLVSAAAKKAISDFPVDELRGKKAYVDITIIFDEGGGAMNGGRPSASETLSAAMNSSRTSLNGINTFSGAFGGSTQRGQNVYTKDLNFNSTDSRHLTNLFSSYFLRNNVLRNPVPETDGEADYLIEIMVDVFGTIWKRTDWGIANSDNLSALISYEYVITPLKEELKKNAKVGSVSYEAFYKEKYILWMGPTENEMVVRKSNLSNFVGTLGNIEVDGTSNIRKDNPRDFVPSVSPTVVTPIIR